MEEQCRIHPPGVDVVEETKVNDQVDGEMDDTEGIFQDSLDSDTKDLEVKSSCGVGEITNVEVDVDTHSVEDADSDSSCEENHEEAEEGEEEVGDDSNLDGNDETSYSTAKEVDGSLEQESSKHDADADFLSEEIEENNDDRGKVLAESREVVADSGSVSEIESENYKESVMTAEVNAEAEATDISIDTIIETCEEMLEVENASMPIRTFSDVLATINEPFDNEGDKISEIPSHMTGNSYGYGGNSHQSSLDVLEESADEEEEIVATKCPVQEASLPGKGSEFSVSALPPSSATRPRLVRWTQAENPVPPTTVVVDGQKVELRPPKVSTAAKRVSSFRKSLNKISSFGRDHVVSKDKHKKDKQKDKGKLKSPSSDEHRMSGSWDDSDGQTSLHSKSPDARSSTSSGLVSPSGPAAKHISGPQLVNPDMQQRLSVQKASTIQKMLDQVTEEYEQLRVECNANPTETNYARVEQKQQVLLRLRAQLNSVTSPGPGDHHDLLLGERRISEISNEDGEHRRRSLNLETDGGASGLPPHPPSTQPASLPVGPVTKRHRTSKTDSVTGPDPSQSEGSVAGHKQISLSRSHSDSYRQVRRLPSDDGLRQTASNDELEKLRQAAGTGSTSVASSASSDSVKQPGCESSSRGVTRSRSKSQEMESISDDTVYEAGGAMESPLSPVDERSMHDSIFSDTSGSLERPQRGGRHGGQTDIMCAEEDEFSDEDDMEDQGVFTDFMLIRERPAHLAVFLHYLISNSNPLPLLFFLVTEPYCQYSGKDVKEMRKWAYEIYSSFVVDKAPLKVNLPDEVIAGIENTLNSKTDKEDKLRGIFFDARNAARTGISDLLADYRCKRALGLGSLYGDHELKDKMDHASIMKSIDKALWRHFERFISEEMKERSMLLASSLATFFKHVAFTSAKSSQLIDKCPSFVAKDKKTWFSKIKSKGMTQKNHTFQQQQYVMTTHCAVCQKVLCGIGYQGYQCTKCEQNVHKGCCESIREFCTGKKAITAVPSMKESGLRIKQRLIRPNHSSRTQPPHDDSGSISSGSSVAAATVRQEDKVDEEHHDANRRHSDEMKPPPYENVPETNDHSDHETNVVRSPSINSTTSRFEVPGELPLAGGDQMPPTPAARLVPTPRFRVYNDSDLETEAELPLLDTVIAKDILKKLKPKERKWQDVVNELFYTERAHVRNLKVMQQLFYQPMKDDPTISPDFVSLLFPNIDDMVTVHGGLNNDFKQRKKDSANGLINNVADILIHRFTGEEGTRFKTVCAVFIENQKHALERLRAKQQARSTKDQKFIQLLQEAISHPLCRRLALKDLLPTAWHRLTKYPLLIEKLLSYSTDSGETSRLQSALAASKHILSHVDQAVKECENKQKLADLQRRLDKRPFESSAEPELAKYKNLDLTQHRLVYDGALTWRLSATKDIDVHVVLLEDLIVILQRQDDKLVLRCPGKDDRSQSQFSNYTHSPIMRLEAILLRMVANDKRALYVISTSDIGPQIYQLITSCKDERNKWLKYITEAADVYKESNPLKTPPQSARIHKYRAAPKQTADTHGTESLETIALSPDGDATSPDSNKQDSEQRHDTEPVSEADVSVAATSAAACDDSLDRTAVATLCDEMMMMSIASSTAETFPENFQASFEKLREANELVHHTMLEKQRLLSNLLQIPEDDYETVAEMSVESVSEKDTRELLLSSMTLAERLTSVVNGQLDPVVDTSTDSLTAGQINSSSAVVTLQSTDSTVSQQSLATQNRRTAQLINISSQLHQNLAQLLELIIRKEEEQVHLQTSLQSAEDQLSMLGLSPSTTDQDLYQPASLPPDLDATEQTLLASELQDELDSQGAPPSLNFSNQSGEHDSDSDRELVHGLGLPAEDTVPVPIVVESTEDGSGSETSSPIEDRTSSVTVATTDTTDDIPDGEAIPAGSEPMEQLQAETVTLGNSDDITDKISADSGDDIVVSDDNVIIEMKDVAV